MGNENVVLIWKIMGDILSEQSVLQRAQILTLMDDQRWNSSGGFFTLLGFC